MKRIMFVALALALGTVVLGGCKKKEEKKPVAAEVSKGISDAGKAVTDAAKK
ncbi:MAG: hypothetical protein WCP22_00945 [Chlamydiota bacterium]